MEYIRIADIKRLKFITDTLQAALPNGGKVLDVGCGNGIIARGIADAGFTVDAIDISVRAIEKAKALTVSGNVHYQVQSAEQLAATGSKYEAIICSEVLEHLNEPEKLLLTLRASLHNNGVLIVTVPNGRGPREMLVTRPVLYMQRKNNWAWQALRKVKALLRYDGSTIQSDAEELTHVQFFSKKDLGTLAAQNEFKITRFGSINFIDDVFPFSVLTRKFIFLQKLDAFIADRLPPFLAGSFASVWAKA